MTRASNLHCLLHLHFSHWLVRYRRETADGFFAVLFILQLLYNLLTLGFNLLVPCFPLDCSQVKNRPSLSARSVSQPLRAGRFADPRQRPLHAWLAKARHRPHHSLHVCRRSARTGCVRHMGDGHGVPVGFAWPLCRRVARRAVLAALPGVQVRTSRARDVSTLSWGRRRHTTWRCSGGEDLRFRPARRRARARQLACQLPRRACLYELLNSHLVYSCSFERPLCVVGLTRSRSLGTRHHPAHTAPNVGRRLGDGAHTP